MCGFHTLLIAHHKDAAQRGFYEHQHQAECVCRTLTKYKKAHLLGRRAVECEVSLP